MKDIDVEGKSNVTAGRDVKIFSINGVSRNVGEVFKAADDAFKAQIQENGMIKRGDKDIEYSSKSLFGSLMQLGIPFDASINIPFQIVSVLSDMLELNGRDKITTADIRIAVVECIGGLIYDNHTEEEVSMWSAAYIRRYGNPSSQSLLVNDNGDEKELTYDYVKKTVIPHLFKRIVGLEGRNNPISEYPVAFTSVTIDRMSNEIVRFFNTLNLYCIRYKTLINLLEDLVIEPPHPWIVNSKTKKSVTEYNLDRAAHHLALMKNQSAKNIPALFNQASRECFMHLSASILSKYGAFLGVGSRYGMLELRRILSLKDGNAALWEYCNLCDIDKDLDKIGCSTETIIARLNRILHQQNIPDKDGKFDALFKEAVELSEIVVDLTKSYPRANKKLQRTLASSRR